MDLTERKKQILKRVVEDYIAAAEPVGSKALAEEMGGSVSSRDHPQRACQTLVEMGYLEQPAHVRRTRAVAERLPLVRQRADGKARGLRNRSGGDQRSS